MRRIFDNCRRITDGITSAVKSHPWFTFLIFTGAVFTFNRFVVASGVEAFTMQDVLNYMSDEAGLQKLEELGLNLPVLRERLGLITEDPEQVCLDFLFLIRQCVDGSLAAMSGSLSAAFTYSGEVLGTGDPVNAACNLAELTIWRLPRNTLETCVEMVREVGTEEMVKKVGEMAEAVYAATM